MGRRPRIPAELTKGPFTLSEARAAGLSARALEGRSWRRIGPALYRWIGLEDDVWHLLQAWHRRLPGAVFMGLTAAWLHRLDVDPCHPFEVAMPLASGVRSRQGIVVRRRDLAAADVLTVRGLPATSMQRTVEDLCRTLPEIEALVVLDAALRRQLIDRTYVPLARLAEPAESPMETRLRWLLLEAGLPRPQVQKNLHDAAGRFVGRADLYYPAARLVIEYDGVNHRDRLADDDRRQNLLIGAGFRILRFTAADLRQRPGAIVAQVGNAL